jgi:hypothetical protein
MLLLEPSVLGNDIRRNALRFADHVADRGRDAAEMGRSAYHRLTSNRRDPIDELRSVAAFAVGTAALVGVGYLITRLVRSRRALRDDSARRGGRGYDRGGRSVGAGAPAKRDEPTHELLARLDSPEAIQRHNELVRQMHENARPSRERAAEHAAH